MPQQVRENVFLDRLISMLSAAFAVLATLLAAIGLYGVLAYTVAQRTREIGLRMALGADGASVRGMVLRQVGVMTLIGGVDRAGGRGRPRPAGAVAALRAAGPRSGGARRSRAVLLTLRRARWPGFLPAQRASRIDPMMALRNSWRKVAARGDRRQSRLRQQVLRRRLE